MKKFLVAVQQWENEKCGPNNVLSKFKYSLHKNEFSAQSFITEYQKKEKVTRIHEIQALCVDEETYNKVINQDKKGEPFVANSFLQVTFYSFS